MAFSTPVHAQAKKKNPASKVYVTNVSGEALIDTGDALDDMSKRSVYTAQGAVIETKKTPSGGDQAKNFLTIVFSNGTGAFLDADTRVEIKRFEQEPFIPNRTDIEVEPSISQTHIFVSRGTVGLSTSKLVAGSSMTIQTPDVTANIRGQNLVIEAGQVGTKISMLKGDSTLRAGAMDMGGHMVEAGQQAIIRGSAPGQPNQIQIAKISPQEAIQLADMVAMASMAKKTVYFEERQVGSGGRADSAAETTSTAEDAAAGGEGSTPSGPVTAFDGNTGRASSVTIREIVPVPVVPANLPVQFTISPARIITPGPGG